MHLLDDQNYGLHEAAAEPLPQPEQQEKPTVEAQNPVRDEVSRTHVSDKENNIRILRERAERAEQRAQELERYMQTHQPAQQSTQQTQSTEEDDVLNISDDSYLEGKDLKRIYKKQQQELREIKQALKERDQKTSLEIAETKLRADYPDIAEVITNDNLKDLAAIRPDIYETVMYNPDPYKRGRVMREMIQTHVLNGKYTNEDKRLEQNRNKPKSAATVSPQSAETPLSTLGDYDRRVLTEERKEQLRRQVAASKMYR